MNSFHVDTLGYVKANRTNRYPNTFLVWGSVLHNPANQMADWSNSFTGQKMDMLNSDEKIIRKVKLKEKPSFILSNTDIKILSNMSDGKIHPTEKDKVNNFAVS